MTTDIFVAWLVRWIHIASAITALGGPFFIRFALMPAAAKVLDDEAHKKLRAAINARWRFVVYSLITLFLLTGLFNFLVETRINGVLITARWKEFSPPDRRLYHMIFGIKMLAALALFTLASALSGRTKTFALIRAHARLYITILLLLGAIILACSTFLHMLPLNAAGH